MGNSVVYLGIFPTNPEAGNEMAKYFVYSKPLFKVDKIEH